MLGRVACRQELEKTAATPAFESGRCPFFIICSLF
jgi:hypothetical protein